MRSPLIDYYDPYGALQQQAELGLLPDGVPRDVRLEDLLPPEEKRSMLRTLANTGSSGLAGLGWVLDTPKAVALGLISGGPSKALSALWETADERVDGRELLRQYGLVGNDNTWGNFAAGLAAEVLLDPSTYFTFGLGSLLGKGAKTVAGRAAQKAGLMQDFDLFARAQKVGADDAARSMGVREAMRTKTARDLLDYAKATRGQEAADDALRRFQQFGGELDAPLARTNQVQFLGRDIGAFDLYGERAGDWLARTADAIGEGSKLNPITGPLVRGMAKRFDKNVLDQSGYDQQWTAREISAARRNRAAQDRAEWARQAMAAEDALRPLEKTLNDQDVSEQLLYFMEGGYDNIDENYYEVFDALSKAGVLTFLDNARSRALAEAKDLGMPLEEMTSRAGTNFSPRQQVHFDNPRQPQWPKGVTPPARERKRYRSGGRLFDVTDTSGRRREYLDVMGGARTVNAMSRDKALQESLRGASNKDVRAIIEDWAARNNDGKGLYNWLDESLELRSERSRLQRELDSLVSGGVSDESTDTIRESLADIDNRIGADKGVPPLAAEHPLMRRAAELRDKIQGSPPGKDVTGLRQELAQVLDEIPAAATEAHRDKLYEELANWARNLDPQHAERGIPFFGRNSFQDWADYAMRRGQKASDASQLMDVLTNTAIRQSADSAVGGVNIKAEDALRQLGLSGPRATNILAKSLGVENLNDISYSQKDIQDWAGGFRPPTTREQSPALLNAYDDYTQVFKTLALLFPSRYTRDAYSGAFASASKGAFSPIDSLAADEIRKGNYDVLVKPWRVSWLPFTFPARLANAPDFAELVKADPQQAIRKWLTEAGAQGMSKGTMADNLLTGAAEAQMRELYPGAGAKSRSHWLSRAYVPGRTWLQFASDIAPWRLRTPAGNPNFILEAGDRAAEFTDNLNRLGTYLNQTRKGVAPSEAKRLTDLTQVDYGNLTRFEREYLRRLVPFYSYPRGILPYVASEVLYKPSGLVGQTTRAITRATQPSEDYFVPEDLRDAAAIPLPPSLGASSPNYQRFLTNIDLPFESVVNLFSPGVGGTAIAQGLDTVNRTALNFAGQLNPLIKTPLELLTDRQFYSGRELSDLYSSLENAGVPGGRTLEQLLYNVPLGSRLMGIGRQAADDRLTTADKAFKIALNTVAGAKLTDRDIDRTRSQAARQIINQLLSTTPGVRTYENITVPDEALAKLSPEQRKQYLLYRIMQSESARRARERSKEESLADPASILLNR